MTLVSSDKISDIPAKMLALEARIAVLEALVTGALQYATVVLGSDTLVVGTDLADGMLEVISISAAIAQNLANIEEGASGQIKIFRFSDANVTVLGTGNIDMNSVTFAAAAGDILALLNIGGDGDTVDGTWFELFRTIKI